MDNPFKNVGPFLTKHKPEILMGMGISGFIFSVVWGIRASYKAANKIRDYKESKNIEKITFKEGFKLTWKEYLPVAISTGVSIPCIIAGNRISNKRYAALAAAYTISETALQQYQLATKEVVGEKKARQIDEVVNDKQIQDSYKGTNQIIMTNNGESVFYEPLSGRYFKSSWNDISKAANELNAYALSNMTGQITLNDWFSKLGLEDTEIGNEIGWNLDNNPNNLIKIEITSHITKDNIPVGAIAYKNVPQKLKWSSY